MSDFLDGIRKSVQAARESASHQRDVRRREEEAEAARQKLDRQRAAELTELIWERIRDAERAGDGALKAERKSDTARTTFHLAWQESQPERSLQIAVDETEGVIQASWIVTSQYGQSVDAPSIDASRFDIARLEAAIELLVDQRRWARGSIPMIPW